MPVGIVDAERQTALHYAVLAEQEDVVALLVQRGAAVDAEDENGESPLGAAGARRPSASAREGRMRISSKITFKKYEF